MADEGRDGVALCGVPDCCRYSCFEGVVTRDVVVDMVQVPADELD